MKRYVITVGSVTQAIKARDLLRKNGFRVNARKQVGNTEDTGCAYAVVLDSGDVYTATKILRQSGIKITSINQN